jgi:hypothetical protein
MRVMFLKASFAVGQGYHVTLASVGTLTFGPRWLVFFSHTLLHVDLAPEVSPIEPCSHPFPPSESLDCH